MNAGNFSALLSSYDALPDNNVSSYVDEDNRYLSLKGQKIWITASGQRMRDMAKDMAACSCIVAVDTEGMAKMIWQGTAEMQPSSEIASHLAVHNMLSQQERSEHCLVHAHPTELIALSHLNDCDSEEKINEHLWNMHTEILDVLPYGLSYVPFSIPGSGQLARASVKALEEKNLALWEKHGCYALADSPGHAFDLIDVANKAAKIYLTCTATGSKPSGIDKKDLSLLKKFYQNRKQP